MKLRDNTVKKTFKKIDKKGREEEWSWEETPELLAALEQLSKSTQVVKSYKSV